MLRLGIGFRFRVFDISSIGRPDTKTGEKRRVAKRLDVRSCNVVYFSKLGHFGTMVYVCNIYIQIVQS